jgi:hypothetical protein
MSMDGLPQFQSSERAARRSNDAGSLGLRPIAGQDAIEQDDIRGHRLQRLIALKSSYPGVRASGDRSERDCASHSSGNNIRAVCHKADQRIRVFSRWPYHSLSEAMRVRHASDSSLSHATAVESRMVSAQRPTRATWAAMMIGNPQ